MKLTRNSEYFRYENSIEIERNEEENAHRFALSGEILERERERERMRERKRESERKKREKESQREFWDIIHRVPIIQRKYYTRVTHYPK